MCSPYPPSPHLLILLPSLPLCARASYYLLLLFSELYKGPLRLGPFDGFEEEGAGGPLRQKKKKEKNLNGDEEHVRKEELFYSCQMEILKPDGRGRLMMGKQESCQKEEVCRCHKTNKGLGMDF